MITTCPLKNAIKVWQIFTEIKAKKKRPTVYLLFTERAREGLKDINTRAYVAFKEFHKYNRHSGENFAHFLIRFEQLYSKLVSMTLPEAVETDFLLSAANMSEDNEKLVVTTCSALDYTHMKKITMKIFGDPSGRDQSRK